MTETDSFLPDGEGRSISCGLMEVTFKIESDAAERPSLLEITVAPGFDTGLHRHRELQEVFYVLEGELTFTTGEQEEHEVGAGARSTTVVDPGTAHRVANRTERPAKALLTWTPGSMYRSLDELAEVLARDGDLDVAALEDIARRYDTENLPAPTDARH
jgi:quercetin dioxygenase-like cupin family protein